MDSKTELTKAVRQRLALTLDIELAAAEYNDLLSEYIELGHQIHSVAFARGYIGKDMRHRDLTTDKRAKAFVESQLSNVLPRAEYCTEQFSLFDAETPALRRLLTEVDK